MDISRFYKMDLPSLEENAYALQIKYNPPLQEKDRNYIIQKIEKLKEKYEGVANVDISAKRKNKKCLESTLLSTGENEKEYKTHMLVFVPYTIEGVDVYRCFDRYELRKYVEQRQDPHTGEPFTPKQMKVIQKALAIPYPNIPVGNRMEEIQKRLFLNTSQSYREPPNYLRPMHFLKKKMEELTSFVPNYFENFCTELTPAQYYLFIEYPLISADLPQQEAAFITLRYIEDMFLFLEKTDTQYSASRYLFSIGNAMDEFYYMIYHNLNYEQLMEEKGKEVIGEIKELFWKPSFLIERRYENGMIAERYYLNRDGTIKDGPRIFFDEYGNRKQEYLYQNNKVQYINVYTNKVITERYPMEDSLIHGNALFYYEDGENKMGVVSYEKGMKNGVSIFFYKNGNRREKIEYRVLETEKKSVPVGEALQYYENGNIKKKIVYDQDGNMKQKELFYPTETPQEIKRYSNGMLQGEYRSFHPNGKEDIMVSFDKGKMEGPFKQFYDNDTPQEISQFVNGRLEGMRTLFYSSGEKEMEVFMENGMENGTKIEYYSSGGIKSNASYIMGELNGKTERFYESGNKMEESIYQHGKKVGLSVLYFENGVEKERGEYMDDKRVGEHLFFFDNGNPRKKAFYKNGWKDGWTHTYYIDGILKKECMCVLGKKGGALKKYNRNGTLIFSGRCENKVMEGEYTFYFDNGVAKEKGVFVHGKKNGIIVNYYSNGNRESECEYSMDILNGICRYFLEDGKTLRRYSIFENGILENQNIVYYPNGAIQEKQFYRNGELSGPYEKYYENGQLREIGFAFPGYPLQKKESWDEYGKKEEVFFPGIPLEISSDDVAPDESEEEELYFKSGEEDTIFSEEESQEEESQEEESQEEEWLVSPPQDIPRDFYVEEEQEEDGDKIIAYDMDNLYFGELFSDEESYS